MRFNSTQNTLKLGQVSRKFSLRDDVQITTNAVELLENMIPLSGGGATRRPGSWLAFSAHDVETDEYDFGRIRVIPFPLSETQGHLVMIAERENPSGHGSINFRTFVTANAGYGKGGGFGDASGDYFTIPDTSDAFQNDLPSWFGWEEVKRIHYAQSGDKLYLVHPDMEPIVLVRHQVASNLVTPEHPENSYYFTIGPYGIEGPGIAAACPLSRPYRPANITSTSLYVDATTVGVSTNLHATDGIFVPEMVGAYFLLNHSGTHLGACVVTGYVSATQLEVFTMVDFGGSGAGSATTNWYESAWSNYRGWPGAITFYEDRLLFGGNLSSPDTVWASKTANYDVLQQIRYIQNVSSIPELIDYDGTALDTDPFDFHPNAREVNTITYLAAARTLHVGTRGLDFAQKEQDAAISPTDPPRLVAVSSYGSAPVQPVTIGQSVVCVSRDRKKLVRILYDSRNDTFSATNLNRFNDTIAIDPLREVYDEADDDIAEEDGDLLRYAGFQELAYDSGRETIWAIATGRLVGFTFSEESDISGWHQHTLGGEFQDGAVRVNSLCMTSDFTINDQVLGSEATIPRPDASSGAIDFLWLSTSRTIDSKDCHMVEVIRGNVDRDKVASSINRPFASNAYFDCGIEGEVTTSPLTIPGVLDETTLGCLIDDLRAPDIETSDRSIDFSQLLITGSRFQAGFSFTPKIRSFPINAGGNFGSANGAIKRVDTARIHLYRALGVRFGRDEDNLESIEFRSPQDTMGEQTPLFTGTKTVDFNGDYEEDARIYIEQPNPLPFSIQGWTLSGATYD